jgi:hypothetical protein
MTGHGYGKTPEIPRWLSAAKKSDSRVGGNGVRGER